MRLTRLFAATLVAGASLTACQTGVTMWGACTPAPNGDTTGTDGTYVLNCVDGIWRPIMTNDEYVRIRQGENVTIAPLPTQPTTTTSTTTTAAPTTTTTTTSVPSGVPDIEWDDNAYDFEQSGLNGEQFTVNCIPDGEEESVWGSYIYTDDSSICTAAVYEGWITFADGGEVTYEIAPGEDEYLSGTQNGVTTSDYGDWDGSFFFPV